MSVVGHRYEHPTYVDGCLRCKVASLGIHSDALPNRGTAAREVNQREARWAPDMDAYKRLRRQGLQPKTIDGSAELEKRATDCFEVEMGHLFTEAEKPAIREGMEAARELREGGALG